MSRSTSPGHGSPASSVANAIRLIEALGPGGWVTSSSSLDRTMSAMTLGKAP
jgi:hypothetical protein